MLSTLRAIMSWRKQRRRLEKFKAAQDWSRGLGLQETFEAIYRDGKWGRAPEGQAAFWSGNGSKPEHSAAYEDFVVSFLQRHPDIASLVDIGCGDFRVSGRILQRVGRPIDYTGCDIVRPLIAHHNETQATSNRRFMVVNAVEEDPPRGDVVTIRQILQHLSNAQIAQVLERARRLYRAAIITESLPLSCGAPNRDIAHGIATRVALASGVFVDQAPFDLTVAENFELSHSVNEVLRTSLVWFDNRR